MSDSSAASHQLPQWLQVLLQEKFFHACIIHEMQKKNEKNVYCLDCCISLCRHCLSTDHRPHHKLLQIRRYSHQSVVKLDDVARLFDCSSVQIDYLRATANGLSGSLLECKELPLSDCALDDVSINSDVTIGPAGSDGQAGVEGPATTTDSVVQKQSGEGSSDSPTPASESSKSMRKRPRKGIPRRAPFF